MGHMNFNYKQKRKQFKKKPGNGQERNQGKPKWNRQITHQRGVRERGKVEVVELGELPAGDPLVLREREGLPGASQWSPPSGARSAGSSRARTPSGAP